MEPVNRTATSTARNDRIQLIVQLRQAYRQFAQLLQHYRGDSPRTRAALLQATRRLSLMNRALALMALEASQVAPQNP